MMRRLSGDFFQFRQQVVRGPAKSVPPPPRGAAPPRPLTVSELTGRISRVLEQGFSSQVMVQGEVSNCSIPAHSGHCYFTLKDAQNCVSCVMFQSNLARMKFSPRDGMELVATGSLQVYGRKGQYQLNLQKIQPVGQGALELAFQQIKARLEAEGLFDPARKKPIPRYPLRIALVTSREAAALQDQLKVLRKYSWVTLSLYGVPVQGAMAAPRIAASLEELSREQGPARPDLILLGRGGGSLEDLWAFNEEIVARAVAACAIPIISGIGHEVDVSIADLAADYHAHTPTEAAQVAMHHWRLVPQRLISDKLDLDRLIASTLRTASNRLSAIERHEVFRRPLDRLRQLQQYLDDRQRVLDGGLRQQIHRCAQRLAAAADGLAVGLRRKLRRDVERCTRLAERLLQHHPRLRMGLEHQRTTSLSERLARAAASGLQRRHAQLAALDARLRALSPEAVLQRGYSITTLKRDGSVVRSSKQIQAGDKIMTRLADGEVLSTVQDAKQLSLFE